MTSPGIKRPLDLEIPQNGVKLADATASNGELESGGVRSDSGSLDADPLNQQYATTTPNGNKRLCTASANQQPITQAPNERPILTTSASPPSPPNAPNTLEQDMQQRLDSPISQDIDALIRDELQKSQKAQHGTDTPILTARQTQSICGKLIQALRDEFDRKLAAAVAAAAAAASNDQSITNVLAAAFMQRSAVRGVANSILSPPPNPVNPVTATCTAQNLPNLSNLAASLAANSHNSAIPPTHLTSSYMRQNAAAAAIRQVQMQQQQQLPHQHPMQLQHSIPHQVQHRNSVCSNSSPIPLGPVLLTSNLDEQLAVPEALFTLFGVFGDVVRVKILFNKKDNALIQMADANQAQVAQGYLDKQKIYGKVIRVTRSKHQLVQMPREANQSDAGLTKDFTNSPLHRFKIPNSRNCLNIYPPSNTLHISNIPATVEEIDLHKAFKENCGFEFNSFKFFPKERKMALMKFDSIEQATIALIKMHNFQISDENNLRVSFSKSSM